jgi:hypothetical protein
MKAILKKDNRNEIDREYDTLWNKLCREANLSARQSILVARYLRSIIERRIHEIESAVDMGWLLALIESEHFGTDVKRGATRLPRVQQKAADYRNEAYGHKCLDANGVWQRYDGCGLQHLQQKLLRHGVEYDFRLGEPGDDNG